MTKAIRCVAAVMACVCLEPGLASAQSFPETSSSAVGSGFNGGSKLRGQGFLLPSGNGGLGADVEPDVEGHPYEENSPVLQTLASLGLGAGFGLVGVWAGSSIGDTLVGGAVGAGVGYTSGVVLGALWAGGRSATEDTELAAVGGALAGFGVAALVGVSAGLADDGSFLGAGFTGSFFGLATMLVTVPVFTLVSYNMAYPDGLEVTSVTPILHEGGGGFMVGGRF